jgi:hypothetical protein
MVCLTLLSAHYSVRNIGKMCIGGRMFPPRCYTHGYTYCTRVHVPMASAKGKYLKIYILAI